MNFPNRFSFVERCQAQAILDEAAQAAHTYAGNYTSPWLLSSIYTHVWRISKGKETRTINGELTNFYEFQWAALLPDGTNLIDPINETFLRRLQQLVFLARELPDGPDTLSTHKLFFWSMKLFARWAYLHDDIFDPRRYAFTKIKKEHLIDFFVSMGQGGTVFALYYPQRLIQAIFPLVLNRNPTSDEMKNPNALAPNDCIRISQWLIEKGAMKKGGRPTDNDELYINHSFIARMIQVDANTVRGGPGWRAFLRQFSVQNKVVHKGARRRISGTKREYASHRDLTDLETEESGTSEKTLGKYFDDLKVLCAMHRHLPDVCPDPSEFKPKELWRVITSVTNVPNHTPWIPITTALSYTTEALRWVHVYGEDLVTSFLDLYEELYKRGLLVSAPVPENENPSNADYVREHKKSDHARESFVAGVPIPDSIKPLNLSGWRTYQHIDGRRAFIKLRDAPSMLDAIMVLVGAIVVIVGIVKPIRESELRALKNDCLLFIDGDGYWLSQDFRKRNDGDARPVDARPIPMIAAKAIQLLRRLTSGLKKIIGVTDEWLLESLFTLPSFGRYEAVIDSIISPMQLNYTLDAFCDYVALSADNQGRRWYLRVHELRKSFLIVFFWTYRYANLDAARWIAGHENATHLYAYIQANFPGDELPSIEAEYASQVLRDYQKKGDVGEIANVETLHNLVCKHFSVRDVSWIDESTLKDWLELQFEKGEFEIFPYSVKDGDDRTSTVIAFRVAASRKEAV